MKLLNAPYKKGSSQFKEHIFEQYKQYVNGAEKISDRRNSANNYFIGINTALFALLGLSSEYAELHWLAPLIYLGGIALSVIFWLLIRSYKQLNSGKFKVIHELEKELAANLYAYEWHLLGEGKDNKKYFPFSHIELNIPIVICAMYALLLAPYILNLFRLVCSL